MVPHGCLVVKFVHGSNCDPIFRLVKSSHNGVDAVVHDLPRSSVSQEGGLVIFSWGSQFSPAMPSKARS